MTTFIARTLLLLSALFTLPSWAQEFKPDVDYRVLATPVTTSVPAGKVEVVELFWYGCPHCYELEPKVEEWLKTKPANVEFVRIPAVLGRAWELDARVYFTAEALGVLEKTHRSYFDAVHGANGRSIRKSKESIADFFATQGVERETFLKTFDSFVVETRLRRSQELVKRYGVNGVPAFIVNGKYHLDGTMAKTNERLFQMLNSLISKES